MTAFGPELLDKTEPIHARQHPVHDQGVVLARARKVQARHAVMGLIHGVTLIFQGMHDMSRGLAIILDQQHSHGFCSPNGRRLATM